VPGPGSNYLPGPGSGQLPGTIGPTCYAAGSTGRLEFPQVGSQPRRLSPATGQLPIRALGQP
jgi:hypothetical protein